LDGFELHPVGLNEKPEQLKAALVLLSAVRAEKLKSLLKKPWTRNSACCPSSG
jgi:hypothetical protein